MDVYCRKCGEPWDMDSVMEFDQYYDGGTRKEFYSGKGCPSCNWGEKAPINRPKQSVYMGVLTELLGDDIDGIASELEDLDYMGELFD